MKGDLRAVDTVMRACVPESEADTPEETEGLEDGAIVQALGGSVGQSKKHETEQ
jgi:hypothetical protein